MIKVTRINGREQYYINEDQIELMEETPDTVITLMSGRKFVVKEPVEELKRLIYAEKRGMWKYMNVESGSAGK